VLHIFAKLSCVSKIHALPPELGQIRPLHYVVLYTNTVNGCSLDTFTCTADQVWNSFYIKHIWHTILTSFIKN